MDSTLIEEQPTETNITANKSNQSNNGPCMTHGCWFPRANSQLNISQKCFDLMNMNWTLRINASAGIVGIRDGKEYIIDVFMINKYALSAIEALLLNKMIKITHFWTKATLLVVPDLHKIPSKISMTNSVNNFIMSYNTVQPSLDLAHQTIISTFYE